MASVPRIVTGAMRRCTALSKRPNLNAIHDNHISPPAHYRLLSTVNSPSAEPDRNNLHGKHQQAPPTSPPTSAGATSDDATSQKPGAIGGFMRGLIGGQSVAVEDAFVAEAKEQGVDLPPPTPQRHATLVPVRRRKRKEETDSDESIRDRIFGRFAGSAFMGGAFNAKERVKERIDDMDNPIVNMVRNLYDRIFAENEMGMVIREIREDDADFRISEFLREVEFELVPAILGAYLNGDRNFLKKHCTEEAYAMLNASILERDSEGIVMDTNILYTGDVELTAGRLLEDSPVLIVSFNTQQINCLKDKRGDIVEGREDDIRAVYYAWAFVRETDFEEAMPSGGGMGSTDSDKDGDEDEKPAEDDSKKPWKLMEMVIRGAHSTI